jgi:enediyne biosynthesis protein E4
MPHFSKHFVSYFLCLQIILATACSVNDDEKTLFTKISQETTGIDFVNENHETEKSNILSYEYFYNGGGVALGDINNDGLTDIYFTSNIFSNKLYLNKGNFKFEDITSQSGTACEVGWKTGVTMVDINQDGLLDIYVCRSASPEKERRRNLLLINNGDLTFTDQAKKYGLDESSYSTQAAFFDYDRDNDLDVLLLNHSLLSISNVYNITVKNSNTRYAEVGNKLLRNDNSHFTDISDTTGVYGSAFNYGLGISISDINNDGWPDLYAGCDYTGRDKLLFNDQGKFFQDETDRLSHISKFTMGTDIADIDGDGNMDILTLDMLPEDNYRQKQLMGTDRYDVFNTMVKSGLHAQYMRNMLHLNNGDGTFSEVGQLAGISNTDWSWGALIQDFDNDGIQDIFVSNGFKRDLTNNDFAKFQVATQMEEARKRGENVTVLEMINRFEENKLPNYVFKGNGDLTFTDATRAWGLFEPSITNGVAYGDLDNDGDLDMVTNNMNDNAGIYRNNAEQSGNNYVALKLEGDVEKFAIGARVTVFADGKGWVKEIFPVRGFQSSVDYRLHFGLGKIQQIDSVQVRWPLGKISVLRNIGINKLNVIKETEAIESLLKSEKNTFFAQVDNIAFTHKENEFNDFDVQRLLPRMYSTEGPAMAKADLDKDGLEDVFIGGAKGQPSMIYVQNKNKNFVEKPQKAFEILIGSEVVDAIFFDMDKDGDDDLYVVSGGYEFEAADKALDDFLFENKGKGDFILKAIPGIASSGSCVRQADLDQDGDLDLFVGGRIVPGRYPETPESYVLTNDGKGNFIKGESASEPIKNVGMVTDACWVDLNQDSYPDLVMVGEWMPIKVFVNEKGQLRDRSSGYVPAYTEGFWNCIQASDFDSDGDVDFIAGNLGSNSQMKPANDKPVSLYFADYDNNGSIDPILDYYIKDASYPYPTRDELIEQLPSFRKRFTDYKSYSMAKMSDVLSADELKKSQFLKAYLLKSCLIRNDSGKFSVILLSNEFQMAPIFSILDIDLNLDGRPDIITAGNLSGTRSRTGKLSGNYGCVGLNDGKGEFKAVKQNESGLSLMGDVRQMLQLNEFLVIGVNNQKVIVYQRNNSMQPHN